MFKEFSVEVPKHDCDVRIVLPGGDEIIIQLRPSNADFRYNGSLDIILPKDDSVICWEGDDMTPATQVENQPHCRKAKQLVTQLPGDYGPVT